MLKKKEIVIVVICIIVVSIPVMLYYRDAESNNYHIVWGAFMEIGYQLNVTVEALSNETDPEKMAEIEKRFGEIGFYISEYVYYIATQPTAGKWKKYNTAGMTGWLYAIHMNDIVSQNAVEIRSQIETVKKKYDAIYNGLRDNETVYYDFSGDPKHIRQHLKEINALCDEYEEILQGKKAYTRFD